jgi:selenocysteine-specific elongation factor
MVSLYGYRPVEANSSRLARLRLTRPIVLLPGDRFVLRHGSPITTIGGGVVLDVHPLQRLKKVRTQQWLQEILVANAEEQLALRVARRGTAGITLADLSRETGLKADAINGRLRPLVQSGKLCSLKSGLFLSPGALLEASNAVQGEMDKAFQAGGSASVKRAALRSQVLLHPEVVEWALNHLEQNNKVKISGQELLGPTKHLAANSLDEERLIAVERAYRQAGLKAPLPGNLAAELTIDSAQLRKFITILLRERILVRLGDDSLCVHQTALGSLRESVRSMRGRTIDIAAFKELTGVSRKYAIPLLEYLDRERVTRRQGDLRIVL